MSRGGLKSAERGPESMPGDTVMHNAYGVTMSRCGEVVVVVVGGWWVSVY